MLIFFEAKLVFLANPKTGSTAIEAALEPLASLAAQRPPPLKHTDLTGYANFVAPWLHALTGEGFTTVALMREPIDWLRSWYRFRLRDDEDDPAHEMEGVNFARFVESYATPGSKTQETIRTQSSFLRGGAGQVDRIFRYEDISAFTEFMEESLDCVLQLPRLNVSPEADVSLDAEDAARLSNALAEDVALYQSL